MKKRNIIASALALAIYLTGSISGVGTVWAAAQQDNRAANATLEQETEDTEFDPSIHRDVVDTKTFSGIEYTLYEDGMLYIKNVDAAFTGTVKAYTVPEDCPVQVSRVYIEEGVTVIGDYAFKDSTVEDIRIPEGLQRIGFEAFMDCSRLENIIIPAGLKSIGKSAFYGCTRLEKAVLPDGVESIDFEAFFGCSNLYSITIPSSVIYINDEIHYNDSNERIYGGVFDGCAKLKIYAPSGSYAEEYAKEKGIPVENVGMPVEKPELQPHLGDANQDKSLTAEDALVILKVVVGLEKEEDYEKKYLDANQDNAVTAEDALLDLKKVVGLEPLHDFNWVVSDNTRTMICSQCGETKGHTETLYGDKWGYYDTEMTDRLFEWCNNSRQQAQYVEYDPIGNIVYNGNVHAVSRDSSLDALATSRAVEVLSSWSHNGVTSYYNSENLAKGYNSVFDTVCAWAASHDHAATMTYQYYTRAGAAWFWYDQDGTGENLIGVAVMEYDGDAWMEGWE